jgi:hypothetical protein
MPITINGSGTVTGISAGGLPDGSITPADLSTGAPTWDTSGTLLAATATDAGGIRLRYGSTPLGTTGPAISFNNYNNNNSPIDIASIKGVMTGGAVGVEAGALVFNTATGGAAPTERMRISQDGTVNIQNGEFAFSTAHLFISGARMPYNVGNLTMQWSDTTGRVSITTSTRLLKKDIEASPYGIEAVKALQPRTYTISDKEGESEKIEIGFIADEVTEVIPEIVPWSRKSLVTGNEEDKELIPMSVQYDRISVVLVKALQEAIAKIETLEASNADLLSRVDALEVTP